MVREALETVGAARSIVLDEDNVILAGNGVTTAAIAAGMTKVRIIDADGDEVIAVRRRGLTADQKRALALYDNRTGELATWDAAQLRADLTAGLTFAPWFSDQELRAVTGSAADPTPGLTDPDAVPDLRATSIVVGDRFDLGRHRLWCGDCTADAALEVLATPPAFVFADPPYGIALDVAAADRRRGFYGHGTTAIDADNAPWDATLLAASWIPRWADRLAPAGYLASWTPYQGIGTIERVALEAGLLWLNLFTWVKENPAPGFPEYLAKSTEHACIFRKPGPGRYVGPDLVRDYAVTPVTPAAERVGHPAPKRLDVLVPIIGKLAPADAWVLDPFVGSGSTLLACEQIARRCVGIELNPVYCQMVIDRWEAFTGGTAVKVGGV
jgi:site-specific DNA-methyltransferase (adenine-specific)